MVEKETLRYTKDYYLQLHIYAQTKIKPNFFYMSCGRNSERTDFHMSL